MRVRAVAPCNGAPTPVMLLSAVLPCPSGTPPHGHRPAALAAARSAVFAPSFLMRRCRSAAQHVAPDQRPGAGTETGTKPPSVALSRKGLVVVLRQSDIRVSYLCTSKPLVRPLPHALVSLWPVSPPPSHCAQMIPYASAQIRKEKKLVVHNWRWNAAMPYEVMLFLPGFNNSCRTGTAMFSQFLALGDFPPQLKPFIFSWPSGQIATYYKARDSAESVAVAQSFTEFVSMLIHVGFRRFHILTHSMGGRCWCSVYETAKPLFAAIDAPTRESEGKASLMSVTLINPEFPVQQFVESSYHSLRSRCSNITIYGNKADQALMYAELFNDPHTFYKEPSLGKAIDDPGLGALDVDIVDTTFLQNNVHKTKHSYFNINRELVEDLRDLIVTQRRAAYRIRLRRVKLDTNVFVFMVAPPALQNG